eukprot:4263630-Pyramimonas_sp.AAC.1
MAGDSRNLVLASASPAPHTSVLVPDIHTRGAWLLFILGTMAGTSLVEAGTSLVVVIIRFESPS